MRIGFAIGAVAVAAVLVAIGQSNNTPSQADTSNAFADTVSAVADATVIPQESVAAGPASLPPATTDEETSATAPPTVVADPAVPGPPPLGETPGGWDEAIATGDMAAIRDWYVDNTGFSSFYSEALGRNLERSDLIPMDGIEIFDDDVVIEGAYITGRVRIYGDNVTIRGSIIDTDGFYTYGVQATGDDGGRDWTIEHVTFANLPYEQNLDYEMRGNSAVLASTPGVARFNQTLNGFGSGYRSIGSAEQLWEYNFVDRIVRSPGSHNTSMTLRSNLDGDPVENVTIRRNLLLDGTSAAFSFYSRSTELHRNIYFVENIFDLPYTTTTNYCAYTGAGHGGNVYLHENVQWIGTIYGQSLGPQCGASGPSSGEKGDIERDNRFIDGSPS